MVPPREDRLYRWATIALFVVAAVLVLATFRDYGITWDEHYHNTYGKFLLSYYLSGFTDTQALTYHNLWLYGGAFDTPTALAKVILPFGDYETQHLMIAVAGLIGVFGCYRIGVTLGGARAGFWAALLLLLLPAWYGHMFINPKDIPFAAGMTWTLYFLIRAAPFFPRVPLSLTAKLGVALGLTLGIRISGVFALIYVAAALSAWGLWRLYVADWRTAVGEAARVSVGFLLPVCLVAYATMLLAWPWALQHPLTGPFHALRVFSNSPWILDTLFDGKLVNSLHLPASYLPVYFAVKTPEITLVLVAVGAVLAGAWLYREHRLIAWPPTAGHFLLGFAVLFPFAFFVAFRPVTYDTIRHFIFVLPPVAVAAALALDRLIVALAAQRPVWRGAFATVVGAYLAWHVAFMAELHPNQYVYYNQLVGGVDGAEDRYELDYWGNSYHEAVDKLVDYVKGEERETGFHVDYKVWVCAEGTSASYFFPHEFQLAANPQEADFYISVTRLGCDRVYDGDVILTVERDDAVLSVVKDRRRLRAVAPERLQAHLKPDTVPHQHPGLTLDGHREAPN